MEKLDNLVAEYIEQRLLQPTRLEQLLSSRTRSPRPNAPSDEGRTLPNCVSARPRQTPNSSGSTMRSRMASPISSDPDAEGPHCRAEGHARSGPRLTLSGPRMRLNAAGRLSHHKLSRRLPGQPASACGPRTAATAAITSARSPNASKSISERIAHHGIEKRAPAHAGRGFKRKNGGFWRAQFCTEVARPERFERPTLKFVVQKYLFAALLKCTLRYDESAGNPLF